jgi:hypothetical protein
MKTYRKLHEGLRALSELTGHEKAWVANKLRTSVLPQEAISGSKLLTSLAPRKRPVSVFLSHNSSDKPFVRGLYRHLSRSGMRVWIDEAELNAGDSLIDTLSDAVFRVDCIVAVISEASVASRWVKKELAWAMAREIKGRRVRVIPIIKDDASVPKSLSDKLWLDFSSSYLRQKNRSVLVSSILAQTARRTR